MKKCPQCKIELSLLGLLYKKKYPQYLCSKCKTQYLEVPTFGRKTLIISRESKEMIDYVIEENKEILQMLADGDGHPRKEHCSLCSGKGWIWNRPTRKWYSCTDCNDDNHIPEPREK